MRFTIYFSIAIFALFSAVSASFAQNAPSTPFTDKKVHEGVVSCYGSTCHSRQEATGVVVRQNEILTWQDDTSVTGAHYRAYRTLLTDRSARIVGRLGLGPANEAKECLSCHMDGINPKLRGPKFQKSDGVGCESCHGASGEWLSSHYQTGGNHKSSVAKGLYALEDPIVRAGVCLSCHLGSEAEGQFVNHRLMAAGHPRISFELDLFTALQSHHDVDIDYENRKAVATGARTWAVGQAMALKQQLRLFQNPNLNKDGIFPELVFFDCLSCHRPISDDPDWKPLARPNPGRPNAPGVVKFNDANMIMLLAAAKQIAPDIARTFDTDTRAFHASLSAGGSAQAQASQKLQNTTDALMARIKTTNVTRAQTFDVLDTIVTDTLTRRYTDYVAAEQAIMAVDTLLSSMIAAKQIAPIDVATMRKEINIGYDAVENPNDYDQDRLTSALGVIHQKLKELR